MELVDGNVIRVRPERSDLVKVIKVLADEFACDLHFHHYEYDKTIQATKEGTFTMISFYGSPDKQKCWWDNDCILMMSLRGLVVSTSQTRNTVYVFVPEMLAR
jgi:hypothetical protein